MPLAAFRSKEYSSDRAEAVLKGSRANNISKAVNAEIILEFFMFNSPEI